MCARRAQEDPGDGRENAPGKQERVQAQAAPYPGADQKWQEYRAHCDRLFFAFTQDLPCEIFPADTGLIVADAYGAHMHCEAPEHRLPAPTRKSMTVRFAMAAAQRINRLVDPQGHAEF